MLKISVPGGRSAVTETSPVRSTEVQADNTFVESKQVGHMYEDTLKQISLNPVILLLEIYSKELIGNMSKTLCSQMFVVSL